LDLYCAKAICSQDSLRDPALANFALQISLPPRPAQFSAMTQEASKAISDTFQARLLGYGLTHFRHVATADIDVRGLTPPTQGLARALAACILADKKLQSEVVPLLRDQDREITEDRSGGLESVILGALLHFSHEGDRPTVTVAALAEETNAILSRKGLRLLISPETVGWKLRFLRVRTESVGSGRKGLWLLADVRRRIHTLAVEYQVSVDPDGAAKGCPYCPSISGEGQFAGVGGEKNSEDLSKA
jgi:hypothetical protein